jgi:uridine kinase
MSIEKITYANEFDQNIPKEVERKLLPLFPEELQELREASRPIEQLYLSHPDEPFSLRLRESFNENGQLCYEATLKDAGHISDQGLERLEVTADITANRYLSYKMTDVPLIRKLRAEPLPGIAVDFYEDGSVRVESEDERAWETFSAQYGHRFIDVTGDKQMNNEWLAHLSFRRTHNGAEALATGEELVSADIVRDTLERLSKEPTATIHIGGRSGSGKSTIVSELRELLTSYSLPSLVLSTDDYHRGTRWLVEHNDGKPWIDWDAPIVYDTALMAEDLTALHCGEAINRREIDWSVAEPVVTGTIAPAPVIIIEGIYALHPDITSDSDLTYEMTTSLATCIGRRLLRDLKERPEFADPTKSLGYMLEYAEPAYQAQRRART